MAIRTAQPWAIHNFAGLYWSNVHHKFVPLEAATIFDFSEGNGQPCISIPAGSQWVKLGSLETPDCTEF